MPTLYIADEDLKDMLNEFDMFDELGEEIVWELSPIPLKDDDYIQRENIHNADSYFNENIEFDNNKYSDRVIRSEGKVTYISRSNFTWTSTPQQTQRSNENETISSRVVNEGKNVTSVKEAFKLFISDEMMGEIIKETNQFCQIMNEILLISNEEYEFITYEELCAFFAILLVAGLKCKNMRTFIALWDESNTNSHEFYEITLARHRFFYIFGNIQFDNFLTRQNRLDENKCKYEAIRNIFEQFTISCAQNYSPGKNINVSKRLIEHLGPCSFRIQENPAVPPGIRLWLAADSKSLYISNLYIDTGKIYLREEHDKKHIVVKLMTPYYGSGRGVTTHSELTSIELAEELLLNNIKMTGIITMNKMDIPLDFLKSENRTVGSTMCAFTNNLFLISYCPIPNRVLPFLTTENQNLSENIGRGNEKPKIIQHQLATNGAVRKGIMMAKNSSCVKGTGNWTLRLFMELIDIAILNSFVIWLNNNPNSFSETVDGFRNFIADLATQLSLDNINCKKLKASMYYEASTSISSMSSDFHEMEYQPVNDLILNLSRRSQGQSSPEDTSGSDYPSTSLTSHSDAESMKSFDSNEFAVEICDSTNNIEVGCCDFCLKGIERKTRIICLFCQKRMCNSHRHIATGMCFKCSLDILKSKFHR